MYHPTIALRYLDIEIAQDARLIEINTGRTQGHQHAPLATRQFARRISTDVKCVRVLPQQFTGARRSQRAATSNFALLECQQVRHDIRDILPPMGSENPWHARTRGASQPLEKTRMIARVEPIGDLVEQQKLRPAGERPRDQYEPPLGERGDIELPEQTIDPATLGRRQCAHRNVGALDTRRHHFTRAEIPIVVLVAILTLGAEVGDLFAQARGGIESFAA